MQGKKTEHLIKKAKKRDSEAFVELMQLYQKDMYRIALAILMNDEDAADAIQDTILTCWEKLYSLKHAQYFRTWMTRILMNKCYDIRQKNACLTELAIYEEPAAEDRYNLEFKEALSVLDEKYRLILLLYYSEGYRIHEIAELLRLPKSTVQTRLQRGREKLAKDYYNTTCTAGGASS